MTTEEFVKEFRKLFLDSLHCGSWTRASENCDYGDISTGSKDCYMCFNSGNCRDAYYCHDSRKMTDSSDCAFSEDCELCYECTDCNACYNSNFSQDCTNCRDVHFSYDLRRCKNCIGCVTLRDKEYCIFNEQYSKENYEKYFEALNLSDSKVIDHINKKVEELKLKIPRMYVHQYDTTKCTGDYVYHSKNCHECFDARHTEDSGYIVQANLDMGTKDSFDCGPIPTGMDLCYDVAYSHFLFKCQHLYWCGNLKDCMYTTNSFESEHLFGCHYLKNKQKAFYILNKKVDEEYYKTETAKITKGLLEMGIYTLYDLLNKDLSKPFEKPKDGEKNRRCTICNDEFEIVPFEIEFYKKHNIAWPIYCPSCRANQRINLRNDRTMHKSNCYECKKTLITTYPPETERKVVCLDCYWKHIG